MNISYSDLTFFAIAERGTIFKNVAKFFLIRKTMTLKELFDLSNRQMSKTVNFDNHKKKTIAILSYFIQLGILTYKNHNDTFYYSLNHEYGKSRAFLPYYLTLLNDQAERHLIMNIYERGAISYKKETGTNKKSISSELFPENYSFIQEISLDDLKLSRQTRFNSKIKISKKIVKNVPIQHHRVDSQSFLTINYRYLDQKLLECAINNDLKRKYDDLNSPFILDYIKTDIIFDNQECKYETMVLDKSDDSSKIPIAPPVAEGFIFRLESKTVDPRSLPLNYDNVRLWTINNLLPPTYRSIYTLIQQNNFIADDKLSQICLQPRDIFRPMIISLMKMGLVKMVKNGYITDTLGLLPNILIMEILNTSRGVIELFLIDGPHYLN